MHSLFDELVDECATEWDFGYKIDFNELNNIADLPEKVRMIVEKIIEMKLEKPKDHELLDRYEANSSRYNPNKKGSIDYGALSLLRVSYDIINEAY